MDKNKFEWGAEKLTFKPFPTEENTMEAVKKAIIPAMIISVIATAVVFQSFILFLAGVLFILVFCVVIRLLICVDKLKENTAQNLKERRTGCIKAKVVKIWYEEEADYDYVRIYCQYVMEDGVEKTFKTRKVIGRATCKEGDYIGVFVEPDNYDNYEVDITKCIE
ncbi:MAG: hypothetical protein IJP29_07330 [Lachnospiraceae bacterium]|nr:hypothetical protein [Lachnospiraceae bacterium]